jgi:hypothetical protein
MPRNPVSAGSSRVWRASLPMATRRSFTPCSKPHSQNGRLPSTASVSGAWGIVRYWQRTVAPGG